MPGYAVKDLILGQAVRPAIAFQAVAIVVWHFPQFAVKIAADEDAVHGQFLGGGGRFRHY
jgi:hypothetical protein